ncbi:MAG TPA: SRPBCC domain-containing protein [Chitinophagaceae bacterium]|nr:SRPBCC domain-containing protein [Chitinophagaceae bacterium]
MSKLVVKNNITINAPVAKVWDALVNPEQTKKYMFGCETISDWKPGSTLLWRGNYQGKEMDFVTGKIIDIKPNSLLKYTVIDPNASYDDIPENHLNVTYELSEQDGKTTLTVTQDGFENAAEGEKRYKDVYNNGEGWNPILVEIKKLVEEG